MEDKLKKKGEEPEEEGALSDEEAEKAAGGWYPKLPPDNIIKTGNDKNR